MGYGDVLIAAALAEEAYAKAPELGPVLICDCFGEPRWRSEWEGNPAIRVPDGTPLLPTVPTIRIGKGCLPYKPWTRDLEWQARDHVGSIYLTRDEIKRGLYVRQHYGRFVLLEPTGQDRKNPNRAWHGWAALARRLQQTLDWTVVQLDRKAATRLPGVPGIKHRSFREACGILKAAELAVITEGGITAAAATVGTPAVVIWGGCESVKTAGYPQHVNIADDDPASPCGNTKPCAHCAAAWQRLTPEHVAEVVEATVRELKGKAA